MGLDFIKNYGGRRLVGGSSLPDQFGTPANAEDENQKIQLDIEYAPDSWSAMTVLMTDHWRPGEWDFSPERFVDGKDVGQVIAWLKSPQGFPVPIRLSQVGGVAMRIKDGDIRREFFQMDQVLSMPVDAFPADEIESFALALQAQGLRLLPATVMKPEYHMNYDQMQGIVDQRTRLEMLTLEEYAIAQDAGIPTVVDGALDMHAGGFDKDHHPVFGVIKRHSRSYLHLTGQKILYSLQAGERTPAFVLRREQRPALLTWYVKLNDEVGLRPDSGYVRVEITYDWFIAQKLDWNFADRLSRVLYEYRCRQKSYSRVDVSLIPIVRAEESLGSVFHPESRVYQRFFHVTDI